MDEQQIRKIVKEEIDKSSRLAQYGVTRTSIHTHNNIDSPNLQPMSITGFQVLPGIGGGVLALASNQTVSGPPSDNNILNPPQVVVFPVPIIYSGGGGAAAFNGGSAPNGTVLFFDTGSKTTSALWIKTLNGWYSVTPDSGPV